MVLDLAAVIYYSSDVAALTGLIWSSVTLALVLGSELHHHQTGVPPDHTHISALIRSAVRILNSTFKGDNILLKYKPFVDFIKLSQCAIIVLSEATKLTNSKFFLAVEND